jgi:predicted secreted hydrolase
MKFIVFIAFIFVALLACRSEPPEAAASLDLQTLLGDGETTGFERAQAPRPFTFPADHGPHPAFRSEWWYVTGTLRDDREPERRFGYQFTIFRQALVPFLPPRPEPASAWATRDVYMAHLALTDMGTRTFQSHERFARGANDLAGATASPFVVWVESWSLSGDPETRLTLRTTGPVVLALELMVTRPPVAQGDRGLSVKGPEPGNASHYYSLVHLRTRGSLSVAGATHTVSGTSWLDREWSTSSLSPDVVGWDWLALHLPAGRGLMVYRLRTRASGAAPASRATLIEADGRTHVLGPEDFTWRPEGTWKSPRTGHSYPAGFRLRVPAWSPELDDLTITPWLPEQELTVSVAYWEGAVTATRAGRIVGEGYLEMTGYEARPKVVLKRHPARPRPLRLRPKVTVKLRGKRLRRSR